MALRGIAPESYITEYTTIIQEIPWTSAVFKGYLGEELLHHALHDPFHRWVVIHSLPFSPKLSDTEKSIRLTNEPVEGAGMVPSSSIPCHPCETSPRQSPHNV